mgnify:CR=1 FL=1
MAGGAVMLLPLILVNAHALMLFFFIYNSASNVSPLLITGTQQSFSISVFFATGSRVLSRCARFDSWVRFSFFS